MSQTIVPKSDQLNAEDMLSGPRTVTITGVRRGSAEQPVDIHLAEFDRPFKPSKTVRRILVAAWGPDAAAYVGRRMTIYRDPTVKFGGMDVGGIRISHLSHIDKRFTVALTVTRGKRAPYVIQPLPTSPHDERDKQPRMLPSQYRDEILSASAARLREIRTEIKSYGIADALVTNETGDDEPLLTMVDRIGMGRAAAEGGEPDVKHPRA